MVTADDIERLRLELEAEEEALREKRRRYLILAGQGMGAEGIRDPENPCTGFSPGEPTAWGGCETDGHYMCDECMERATCPGCGRRPAHCECEPPSCGICEMPEHHGPCETTENGGE